MVEVREIEASLPNPLLENADWADCWQARPVHELHDAREGAKAIYNNFPWWTWPLLALRQVAAAPFGLINAKEAGRRENTVGFFPVLQESSKQMVAGIDDKHLDFRLIIDLSGTKHTRVLTLTTLIKRHNLVGKLYLMMVLPFHRAIIKASLKRLALKG